MYRPHPFAVQIQYPDDAFQVDAKLLALKQQKQAGQLNEERLRGAQFDRQQAEQGVRDDQSLRALLGSKPDAPIGEIIGAVGAKRGFEVSTSRNQMVNAGLDTSIKQMSVERDILKKRADDLRGLLGLPPEQRLARNQQLQQDYLKRGWVTPDQLTDQLPDEAALRDLSIRGYGMVSVLDMDIKEAQEKRAKEDAVRKDEEHKATIGGKEAEALQKQLAAGVQTLPGVSNQAGWDAWRNEQPENIRGRIPVMYSPAAAQLMQRMGLTPDQQRAADDRAATRTQSDQHHTDQMNATRRGQDITRSGQLLTDARSRELAAIASDNRNNSQGFKKDLIAVGNIRDAVTNYRTKLDSYDRLVRPGTPEYAHLETAFTNLQMRIKDAYSLGAITGPDMALLDKAVTSPTGWKGRYSGKESLQAQVSEFENILNSTEDVLRKTYNQPARGTQPAGGGSDLGSPANNPLTGKSIEELLRIAGGGK